MKLTFNQAQTALAHLRKRQNQNGTQVKPPLLEVKGWDRAKKVYQLKVDLEKAFETEIQRFQDLVQEAQEIQQENQQLYGKDKQTDKDKKRIQEIEDRVQEINEELNTVLEAEKEVKLNQGKFKKEEFGDIITGEMYMDLDFAMQMEDEKLIEEQNKNGEKEKVS